MKKCGHLILPALALSIGGAAAALAQDGTVTLPQTFSTPYPTQTGITRTVCASGCTHTTLQAAIDAAQPGDVITLAPGSVHPKVTLKSKPNTGAWIVIRSSSTAFDSGGALPTGRRVDGRNTSHTSQMAQIRSASGTTAIDTQQDANHYRLVGLDIGPAAGVNTHTLLRLGSDATTAPAASHIVIDRCYIHGNPGGTHRRGVAMNVATFAVIDSHIAEIHDNSGDDNALAAWNGPGPFKIVNNRLEAPGEIILFGGAPATTQAMSPADIEIRGNLMTKPPAWFDGVPPDYNMKNLFELKDARRVLLEGNILENTWADAQFYALVLTVRSSGTCFWCEVIDITIRNNIIRNAPNAVNFLGTDDGAPSGFTGDVLFTNNVFDNIDYTEMGGAAGPNTIQYIDGPKYITFEHNTFINVTNAGNMITFDGDDTIGFVFRKNLIRKQFRGVFGSGSTEGTTSLNEYAPGWVFVDNGIAGPSARSGPTTAHPPGNQYVDPPSLWEQQFVAYNGGSGGNYRLIDNSIYAQNNNADVGADIDVLEEAIACTQDGDCTGAPPPTLSDTFDTNGAPDPNKWTVGVFTGSLDPTINVTQSGGRLQVGPLPNASGQRWNGVYTIPYDFTGAFAQVQIVQPVVGANAFTTLAVGFDDSNFYRVYVTNGSLICLKEIGGVKTTLQTVPYNASQHAYVRIRHSGANMVCEAAPTSTGTWATIASQAWNTSAVPLASVRLELKTGTSAAVANAGTAHYDNFLFVRP